MGRRHEQKRIDADERHDQLLETSHGRTHYWSQLLEASQDSSMISLLESTLRLPGDVIECGVYRGASLCSICRVVSQLSPEKSIYGCDSFAGFPQAKVTRIDLGFLRFLHRVRKKFQLCNDMPSRLQRFFDMYGVNGHVVKGFFSESLTQFQHHKFCFIHLDCDIYQSYQECLTALYSKLVPGGVVVFDDYGSPKWPGAKKAVDEFFAGRVEKPCLSRERREPAWYIRKQAAAPHLANPAFLPKAS